MKRAWWLLLGLTVTCASPRPLAPAHAEVRSRQPAAAAGAKASEGSSPPRPEPAGATTTGVATGSLATFFRALDELKQGARQRHVRVFWLGDSHTNADFLSGAVRDALTGVFGDGGPGFVRVGTRLYRHDGVKLGRGGRWNVDPDPPARRELQDDGVFGLGGTRAVPGPDATFSLQVKARDDAPARFEVAYSLPAGSSFDLSLGKQKLRVDAKVAAELAPSGIAHLSLTAPLGATLELAPGAGEPRLFHVVVERSGAPGVVLDTVGIDGARLATPLAWSEAAFVAELSRRSPELLVVAFGTNEVFDAVRVDKYGQHLAQLVGRLRLAAPGASCLVLGPTDAPLFDGSRPRVAEVTAALAQGAASLGCSFASLQALMGGEGSFARGMKLKERLAQPDKIHLTPRGYQALGAALARELLDAYSAGRAALP